MLLCGSQAGKGRCYPAGAMALSRSTWPWPSRKAAQEINSSTSLYSLPPISCFLLSKPKQQPEAP